MTVSPLAPKVSLQTPTLSRYITENPQETADLASRKAHMATVAAAVCAVAFIAIVAVALAISFGFPIAIPPVILVGLIFSTIGLQIGMSQFTIKAIALNGEAKTAQLQADELTKVNQWETSQIEKFLVEHKIDPTTLPMDLLAKIDSKEPLKALRPAIARYIYLFNLACDAFKDMQINIDKASNLLKHPAHPDTGEPLTPQHCRSLRIASYHEGWNKLEAIALPAALHAALILQIISKPTLSLTWESYGTCNIKTFDERVFDKEFAGSDDYYSFNDSQNNPLTLTEVYALLGMLDIDQLREKLFAEPAAIA